MRLRPWRVGPWYLVVLCVLLSLFSLARQAEDVDDAIDAVQARDAVEARPETEPTNDVKIQASFAGQRESELVDDAWAILRSLKPAAGENVRSAKPSGLQGTIWHYAIVSFRLLFMNGPPQTTSIPRDAAGSKKPTSLGKAVGLLKESAALKDPNAIFLLAEMNFYSNFTHPRNLSAAFEWYDQLASLNGNSTAQHMLGFMYATGVGDVERDQAKALLYHTYAADQGDTRSEMTVAFRHHAGIGTARNCDTASQYYKRVADKAIAYWRAGPPGGEDMPRYSHRWVEETGGVYGEGASFSSAGFNAKQDNAASHSSMEDILEFLDMRERQGDMNAVFSLGKHHYEFGIGHTRNVKKALKQFMKVARAYWSKDGKVNPKAPKGIDKIAAKAAAFIGRMCLRGEGMEQNFEKAAVWFRRGIQNGDALCQHHMGLMYRDGLGVPQDGVRAATYFKAAAEQDLAASQSALGGLFLDQGEIDTAGRYFELSARQGYTEAFYYLAEMTSKGIGRERHCGVATAYYKIVAERAEAIHSSFPELNAAHDNGDDEKALILSMMAAEQGYESSQANVALLLDEQTSSLSSLTQNWLPLPHKAPPRSMLQNAALALIYWTRSAKQNNIDSLIKMGDYYLSGLGTDTDLDKASTCYHTAAENHHSAQALWDLGWMHENGVGPVAQDFHMAKRYYDLALDMNSEAYLPVKLALVKLRIRSWWNGITGGTINGIQPEDDQKDEKKWQSFSEWIAHFLDAADEMAEQEQVLADDLELDSTYGHDAMQGGDDNFEDFDDGLLESLIIVGLAATLAFLVYYRQQQQIRNRRPVVGAPGVNDQQAGAGAAPAADAQAQDGGAQGAGHGHRGFFPNPGDPDWNQWVAGGVGH